LFVEILTKNNRMVALMTDLACMVLRTTPRWEVSERLVVEGSLLS